MRWDWTSAAVLGHLALVRGQGDIGGSQSTCGASSAWVYKGCFSDSDNGAHVGFTWQLSSDPSSVQYYPGFSGSVTVDNCLQGCRGHGFRWAALYSGSQCYCSAEFPAPVPQASTAQGFGASPGANPGTQAQGSNPNNNSTANVCHVSGQGCSGNANEYCGSQTASDVYEDPSFSTSSSAGLESNFQYFGCFSNYPGNPLYVTLETTDSISCASYCGSLGYPIMGRSLYDSQTMQNTCGCGTEIQAGPQVAESHCSYYCNGSSTANGGGATCGGNGAWSMFLNTQLQGCYSPKAPGLSSSSSYSAPADAGQPIATESQAPPGYVYTVTVVSTTSIVTTNTVTTTATYNQTYTTIVPTTVTHDEYFTTTQQATVQPTTTFFPATPTSSSTSSSISSSVSSSTSSSTSSSSSSSTSSTTSTSSSSSTSAAPTTVQTAGPYSLLGCYNEINGGRALNDISNTSIQSVEDCAHFCTGYAYFGVEYHHECYCGNELDPRSTLQGQSNCVSVCDDTPTEYCGGNNGYLDLYFDSALAPTSSSTSASTSTSSSISSSSTSSTSSSTSSSTTTLVSSTSSASTTSTSTSTSTSSSSSTSTSTSSSTSSSSTSSSTSTGPTTVPTAGSYGFIGCYNELKSGRALSSTSNGNVQSVEDCANFCSGYTYMGVEYYHECYCGNIIQSGSSIQDISNCAAVCSGDSSEYCGGANGYLDIYLGTAAPSSSSSSTTSTSSSTSSSSTSTSTSSSTSTSTSSTSSSASSSGPTTVPTAGPYNFIGCYNELKSGRALSSTSNGNVQSVEDCANFCSGYTYMGLEYYHECYCGNTIQSGSSIQDISNCAAVCDHDPSEYCGGASGYLDIYLATAASSSSSSSTTSTSSSTSSSSTSTSTSSSTSTSTSSTSSTSSSTSSSGPTTVPTAGPYNFIGCYNEINGRALNSISNTSIQSVEDCANFCSGYIYMGVEYHHECYCGNIIQSGSSIQAISNCAAVCDHAPSEYCGGDSGYLDVYSGLPGTSTTSTSTSSSTSTSTSSSSTFTSTSTSTSSSTSSSTSTSTSSSTSTSTGPTTVPSAGPFTFLGCYNELNQGRALSSASNGSIQSVEDCANFCTGYTYMGVEYFHQCFCGNTITSGSSTVDISNCAAVCDGAPTEYCGGANGYLDIYFEKAVSSSSSSSSSSTTSSSTSSTITSSSSSSSSSSSCTPATVTVTVTVTASPASDARIAQATTGTSVHGSTTFEPTTLSTTTAQTGNRHGAPARGWRWR